ncbi:unnamed protein product [Gordionus sp. m RMFG-2023]
MNDIKSCSKDLVLETDNIINFIIVGYIVITVILILGLLGNSIGIYILKDINRKSLHNFCLYYVLIFNNAACLFDLLRNIEGFRSILKHKYSVSKIWMIYITQYNLAIFWSFTQASGLTLCMLLWNRYASIIFPLKYRSYQNKSRLLKILPHLFLILGSIVCLGGGFWYMISECYEKTLNRTVWYRDAPYPPSKNLWRVIMDILNEIFFTVVPTILMLYLAIRITHSLKRFLINKRRRVVSSESTNKTKKKVNLFRRFRVNPLSRVAPNSIDHNIISHIHTNIDNNSKVNNFGYPNTGRCIINISSLMFFALFFICYMPSSIPTFLRYYLVFRDSNTFQVYKNGCTTNKIILNPTYIKKSHSIGLNFPVNISLFLYNGRVKCGKNIIGPEKIIKSLYYIEDYLENLYSIFVSIVFYITLITDKGIRTKCKQDLLALSYKIKNLFFKTIH